jgi:predicted urease superfamily metal-dependent hydrolase
MTYYAIIHTDNRLHIEPVSQYYDLLCYNLLQITVYHSIMTYYAIIFADNHLHIEPVSQYHELLCYNF